MPMTEKAEEPNKATVTYWVADEQTWVVLKNHLCHWATPMKTSTSVVLFDYTFFDNKEEAYAEWLRIDKECCQPKATMSTSYQSGPTSLMNQTGNSTSQPLSSSTLRCG